MVKQGATTIWECWDAIKPDGNRSVISYNHYSLGSVQDYIIRKIGGLVKSLEESSKFIIEPDLESPFEYCNLSYECPYGNIEVKWDLSEDKKELNIVVPVGVTILVKIPNREDKEFGSGLYKINI